jgi:hypothetical protein
MPTRRGSAHHAPVLRDGQPEQIDTGIAALAAAIREPAGSRDAEALGPHLVHQRAQGGVHRAAARAAVRAHRRRRRFGIVQTPEYLARNPNALVPLLEDGDFTLWESNVIVRYLCARHSATGGLYPQDLRSASTPSAGWTGSRPR